MILGDTGEKGDTGNGIASTQKTGTSGLVDTYTITYTNGNTTTFTVSNGKGISSIVKTGIAGLVDTYRITYNDGTYFDYTVTNGQDGEVTEEELQDVFEQMSSELEDSTATGTSIDTTGGAYWRAKLGLSGNTEQSTNIITYTCDGTETGDYYFVYNSTNYQFTMPTVSSGDVIYFNTDTLKLYLEDVEVTTSTASTGILIKMKNTPNLDYTQNIHVLKGSNNIVVSNSDNTQSQNYPITLPSGMELCERDYFYKNGDNWYKKEYVRHIQLPFSTLGNSSNPGWVNVPYIKNDYPNKNEPLKNMTTLKSNITIENSSSIRINTMSSNSTVFLYSASFDGLTGAQLKEKYPDLILDLYYGLAMPIDTQITDTILINQLNDIYNKLKTYQGVSHITQTNADLPFVLTLDYKKSNLLRIKG